LRGSLELHHALALISYQSTLLEIYCKKMVKNGVNKDKLYFDF
jgi:hypothetical protein